MLIVKSQARFLKLANRGKLVLVYLSARLDNSGIALQMAPNVRRYKGKIFQQTNNVNSLLWPNAYESQVEKCWLFTCYLEEAVIRSVWYKNPPPD